MGEIKGYISQVIGPVVDIHFDYGTEETVTLPRIHDAMEISRPNGKILIVEVQQHIGENTVRTVAMDTTDGLRRGMEAVSYGMPITMPTGDQVKGMSPATLSMAWPSLLKTGLFPSIVSLLNSRI